MRLFLDTHILLDIIEERPGLVDESSAVLVVGEKCEARFFIAWHGLATTYYLIRRNRTEERALKEIDSLLAWAQIAPVSASSAARARELGFPDFEDAMQCAPAENALADWIVTRNIKDFSRSPVPAISPPDFLARFGDASAL